MKKRVAESDVRAMAVALTERQGPPPSLGTVQVTILNNYGSPKPAFTGSLNQGTKLVASIKFQAKHTLYIGAVELVELVELVDKTNQTGAEPQQLFSSTVDCVDNIAIPTCQRYFSNDYIEVTLDPINELIAGHGYSFKLRYSESPGVAFDDLSNVTATRDTPGDTIFMASADSSGTLAAESPTTTTTGLSNQPSLKAGPTKPLTVSDSSTATATGTLTTAVPSDIPGVESASAPSKGLSTGAKAGIGVGVAAAVLIVIAVLVALWVRRARRASARNGRGGGVGEKESVLAAAAPGGSGEYRDADEAGAGAGVVGGSPVTRKPVGVPATNEAALADAVSPASTTVGVVGGQSRGAGGKGTGAARESMLNAEERERWEEEERRLDEDIAEAERRRLGA